jgi:hypothetical protein
LLAALRIVQDIDGDEINFFARKKLFRPETAASPGLGKEDELFDGAHICDLFCCDELSGKTNGQWRWASRFAML